MARANAKTPQTPPPAPAQDPNEWQALRGELISLLEQVEGRYTKAPEGEASVGGIAERMRELREQVGGAEPESRRREALRSVKRAVDRFNERGEIETPAPQPNTRNALEAAISEIRSRQQQAHDTDSDAEMNSAAAMAGDPVRREPMRMDASPRFDELARSVAGISGRLERLEVELKAQRHDQTSITEIAEQVSQVSHVVELLAGAVGETGHVKRLESQIAGLARLITEERQGDMTAINRRIDDVAATIERLADLQIQHVSREKDMPDLVRRLDDVSSTVERLADLQVQHVSREKDLPSIGAKLGEVSASLNTLADRQVALAERQDTLVELQNVLGERQAESVARGQQIPVLGQQIGAVSASVERLVDLQTMHVRSIKDVPAQQEALRAGLQAIENGVRSVYDRIDAVERNYALTPDDFEALKAELAQFTQALQASQPPQSLLQLVDVLNSRMTDIESHDADVGGLRDEIAELRQAVIDAIGPRMEAMESRMEALDERSAALAEVVPRIEAIQGQLESVSERSAAIEDVVPRLAAMQDQLQNISGWGAAIEDVVPRINSLQFQMETLAERGSVEAVVPRIVAIQDQLDVLNERGGLVEAVVPRIAAIQDQLDALSERGVAMYDVVPRVADIQKQLESLSERGTAIEDVVPRMAAIQNQLDAIADRGTGMADVIPRIEEIQSQLEALNARGNGMADIQSQLEALNERVAVGPSAGPSVGHIEAQVRQLVARMDQTGEQLNGLARLYSEAGERETGPDYETLAELVAARAAEAIAQREMPPGVTAEDMSDLEDRMSRLIRSVANDVPTTDLADVTGGIRRVDERLERLEQALARLAEENAAPPVGFDMPAPIGRAAVPAADEAPVPAAPAPSRRSDAMPTNPAEDRPLTDAPYPDAPRRMMVETRIGSKPRHPGISDAGSDLPDLSPITPEMFGAPLRASTPSVKEPAAFTPPTFDPDSVDRPPRPESSFDEAPRNIFAPAVAPSPRSEPEVAPSTSRSSFIEAARRAAQRQAEEQSTAGSTSLIGRALARFQGSRPAEKAEAAPEEPTVVAPVVAKAPKPKKAKKEKQAKVEPQQIAAEPAPAPVEPSEPVMELASLEPVTAEPIVGDAVSANEEPNESFLTRHRQPILLAASVVALSFLTLNLITQRLAEGEPDATSTEPPVAQAAAVQPAALADNAAPSQTAAVVPTVAASPAPAVELQAPAQVANGPRVIPMVDTLSTGSINATSKFAPSDSQAMPQAFKAVDGAAAAPEAIESPVKVELPPESVGPVELRQAAADGDARAQFEIGAIYTEGRAVSKDLEAAATWYERAAAQGFAPAQYRLGNLYENGLGVKKDLEQARLWYQRAAEAGNRMSMHNLAALYAGGQLGKQEFASAAEWFEKAAAEGLTDSQFNLGMLYARGLGVPQNMETSYKWFAIAARSGDKDAAAARDDVAKSLPADAVSRLAGEIEAWQPAQINLPANFAPIGTWSASFDPGEVIRTKDVVMGVQNLLKRLGYDVGTPDGVAGPKTAEAIKDFEKKTGMSESGAINPRLLAVLSSQPV